MDTIRLTYNPYGFGRVQRVITPHQEDDAEGDDTGEALGYSPESKRNYSFKEDDDEI